MYNICIYAYEADRASAEYSEYGAMVLYNIKMLYIHKQGKQISAWICTYPENNKKNKAIHATYYNYL